MFSDAFKNMGLKDFFKLALSIAISTAAGFIGSLFTTPAVPGWYAGLIKPWLNPPGWLFGPVWTLLYILMGLAAFIIWQRDSARGWWLWWKKSHFKRETRIALGLFLIQLILNALWSVLFFGRQNPGAAFIGIIFLWLAIFLTILAFYRIYRPAAWLLLPYILWVSFAAYLNAGIWLLN